MPRALLALLAFTLITANAFAANSDPYDLARYEDRIEDLLKKMTVEEKVGQLNQEAWNRITPQMKRSKALR